MHYGLIIVEGDIDIAFCGETLEEVYVSETAYLLKQFFEEVDYYSNKGEILPNLNNVLRLVLDDKFEDALNMLIQIAVQFYYESESFQVFNFHNGWMSKVVTKEEAKAVALSLM